MRIKYLLILGSNILIIITAITLSVFLYKTHKSALLEGIDKKLLTAAYCIEAILPENYHDRIVNKNSVPMDEYLGIVDTYNKLCVKLGLQYMWSLMIFNDQIVFTSGTSTEKDITKSDYARFFDVHSNPYVYKEAFSTMNIQYNTFHDQWGAGRMVLVPKYDSKGRRYLLAASMNINDINSMVGKTITNSFIISVVVFFVGLILSFILSNFLAKPIIRLTEIAKNIASGNLNQKIQIRGSFELINLSKSIETMAKSVNDKIEEVEKQNKALNREIVERKQVEAALRESEEKYRSILENIEDGYFEVDIAGNFTFFNDSVAKIIGYPTDELLGMNNRQYTDEESAIKLYQTFNKVYTTGNPDKGFDWEILRKDGSKRYVEASISLRKNSENKPIGFRGIVRDVTEKKSTNEALLREEEKFRVLVEKSPLGISLIGEDGEYEYVNPTFIEMFGYTLEDIPAGGDWFIKAFPDSRYRHEVISAWVKDLEKYGSGKSRPRSFKVSCKDGSEKDVSFRSVAMETGEQFVTYENITERIQLEVQLQQAQKMEAIGTLAGGVAHDLNNILSGIVSYPELILMDLPEDSTLRKPILTIQKSGEKSAIIVQDLLTLARRGVAISEVVNLNDIISELLKSPEFKKLKSFNLDVQVKTNLDKDLLNVKGSTTHLSKSVMNLVCNASEAMLHGGKILISTENRYIDRPIRGYDQVDEGDYVTIMISDTGIGISKEDVRRIFEPFYTKKVMGRSGTGLGMAVVWGTVKDHKGYIDVESTEGEGTTFTLYFPVTREEIVMDKSIPAIEAYMGKGESVLVVDDVEEQRELASIMLNRLGYSVNTVSSGEEAVNYLKNNSADLLVLDMIMDPGIDGLETYKNILELHPGQKAIIASGFSETERVNEAQKLGAGQYIKKPYTLEKIGLAIKNELNLKK